MSNTVTKGKISTVYKRELALMLRSNIGWIFIAINVAALCIFTAWLCVKNGYPTYEYAAETAAIVNCFAAAFLCAFTVSAEGRRGETAMLARFVSPFRLAFGKFLAQLTLFAVPSVISAVLPLLLLPFGKLDLLNCYMGTVGYILTGMAILAFSSFVCSLIKHKSLKCFFVNLEVIFFSNFTCQINREAERIIEFKYFFT
jgi:ABC-2 type transport system permease protein